MTTNYLSLLLGLLGSAFFIATCFSIKRPRILLLGVISSVLFIGGYIAKSDLTATFMVVTALTRNALFILEDKHLWKWLTRRKVLTITTVLIISVWGLTAGIGEWQWYKLLILVSPLILLYGLSLSNVLHLKVLTMVNGLGWLTYEAVTGAYTVMIGEAFGLLMALLAIIRIAYKTKIPKVSTQETCASNKGNNVTSNND